ncbi:formylglycine-generating enzyme family protein, partial [Rhizobium johnstonii]
ATPVTNRHFASFFKATGHVTVAERAPRVEYYPGALPKMLRAGSLVFTPPKAVVGPDITQWWSFEFAADIGATAVRVSPVRAELER